MPSVPRLSPRSRRRVLLVAAVALTVGSLVAPTVVSPTETYSLSYVGVDHQADAVHDTAYFWTSLSEDERSMMAAAQRQGTVGLGERPRFVGGTGDVQFSVVRDETVYQYSFDETSDPWWFTYRLEAMVVGLLFTVGTLGWGAVRNLGTLWE